MDECDYIMQTQESNMKSVLDSNNSLDNCLLMFTTNYINKIPDAIKERPSRIKECIEFSSEDDEVRVYNILKRLNDSLSDEMRIPKDKIYSIVSHHKESTIDDIKHAFIDLAISHNENIISQVLVTNTI